MTSTTKLAYQYHNQTAKHPIAVLLLHGLLGAQTDWQRIINILHDWPIITLDLPGHGASVDYQVNSMVDVNQAINTVIQALDRPYYALIGYSLGGRLAMHHYCHTTTPRLKGILIEGAHPGLSDASARQQRLQHDNHWAQRFREQPLATTLTEWYQQPLFADLTASQRAQFIALRRHNSGPGVAMMLQATSLARQENFAPYIHQRIAIDPTSFRYLIGANDHKFQTIAHAHRLPWQVIASAGHNTHHTHPNAFAENVNHFLQELL